MYEETPSVVLANALKLVFMLIVFTSAPKKLARFEMKEIKVGILVPLVVGQNKSGRIICLG